MTLTSKQRQYLRALAHPLKPLVQVGSKGFGETLFAQVGEQLAAHELIKVRFNTECAVKPVDAAEELAQRTSSELVQRTGRVVVLYRRRAKNQKIVLPEARARR